MRKCNKGTCISLEYVFFANIWNHEAYRKNKLVQPGFVARNFYLEVCNITEEIKLICSPVYCTVLHQYNLHLREKRGYFSFSWYITFNRQISYYSLHWLWGLYGRIFFPDLNSNKGRLWKTLLFPELNKCKRSNNAKRIF